MPHAIREAINAFKRSPLLAGLSMAMIGLSLLVVGLFAIAAHNIRRVLDQVEARVEVIAFLRDDADGTQVQTAINEFQNNEVVRQVRYVSREQALINAKQELTDFAQIAGGVNDNPFPASIEVSLKPNQRGPEAAMAVAQRLAQYAFVEDVQYGREWLDKVYLLRRVAGAATLILGGAFALVAALIIGAAIRIAVFARRDEISIMRLVGATDGFIRRPFWVEGLITGIIGSIIALIFTYIAYKGISESLFQLEWIPDLWAAGILALGGILGGLASMVAVRRHLREI